MIKISKLLAARQQAFAHYDASRIVAFNAANNRDEAKRELDAADRAIHNFLRTTLPT